MITRRLLAITAGSLLAAPAADILDVRASLGIAPPTEDAQAYYSTNTGATASESVEGPGMGVRFQLGLTKSIYELSPKGQVIASLNVVYSQQAGREVKTNTSRVYPFTGPLSLGVLGAQLGLGYAHWLGEATHLELLPFLGYGSAAISDGGVGLAGPETRVNDVGQGKWREYGFTMAIYHQTGPSKILLGGGFTYFRGHAEADLNFNTGTQSQGITGKIYEHVEIDVVGISPFLSLGMRF